MAEDGDGDCATVLSTFLHAWADALAARDLNALAGLFDDDALFVATAPEPLHGRAQIRTCCQNAPCGLRAPALPLCATSPLPGLVHGIADVVFDGPGGAALRGRLGLSLAHRAERGRASAYQLTTRPPP